MSGRRAVKVWTWRRALRDFGPVKKDSKSRTKDSDVSVFFTLLVLATWMDGNGLCHPSQKTIAKGARTTERTVRRHLARAEALGWLHISERRAQGHGWRRHEYRATVPPEVDLSDVDEELREYALTEYGEVEERADMIVSGPSTDEPETCGHIDPNVRTPVTERADIAVSKGADMIVSDEVVINSPRTPQSLEGPLARPRPGSQERQESNREFIARVAHLMDDDKLASMYGLTLAEVQAIRKEAPQ